MVPEVVISESELIKSDHFLNLPQLLEHSSLSIYTPISDPDSQKLSTDPTYEMFIALI